MTAQDRLRPLGHRSLDKKVTLLPVPPTTTDRNVDEVLRVIDWLRPTAINRVGIPVNWKQGDDVIISGSVSNNEATKTLGEWKAAPEPDIHIVPLPRG